MSSSFPPRPLRSRTVRLEYEDSTIEAASGQRLLDAILSVHPEHRHICGGRGFCTSCRIEVRAGEQNLSSVSDLERQRLGRDAGRLRLACQARLLGNVSVRVPPPAPSRFSPFDETDGSE